MRFEYTVDQYSGTEVVNTALLPIREKESTPCLA